MTILPVLLDSQPGYLQGSATPASLLLSPFWRATLLDHLIGRLPECVSQGVTVLPTFDGGESYQRLVRQTHPRVEAVVPAAAFIAYLPRYEPSVTQRAPVGVAISVCPMNKRSVRRAHHALAGTKLARSQRVISADLASLYLGRLTT